jgi:hypothetical protein
MCADDVTLFGDNTNITKKSTEALIDPSKGGMFRSKHRKN